MFSFQHSNALIYIWFLPIMALLLLYFIRWRKGKLLLLGNAKLLKNLLPSQNYFSKIRYILLLLSIFFIVISLAGPRLGTKTISETKQTRDIVFCIDLSNSMNAADVSTTRLEKAKQFVQQLIKQNANNQMGLVVFAGNAYISVPLTLDVDAILLNLQVLSTNAISAQGTNIGAALKSAHLMFNAKSTSGKSIVLISDGEDHEQEFTDILSTIAADNIEINTVGIGQAAGITLKDLQTQTPVLDDNGAQIISKLNEELLQELATKTSGTYFNLQNISQTATDVNAAINKLEGTSTKTSSFTVYNHYFQYALLPAIILLILFLLMPIQALKKTAKVVAIAIFIFSVNSNLAQAQNNVKQNLKKGKTEYKNKNYPQAINNFQQVFTQPNAKLLDRFSAHFNTGNSYSKQQQWQQAIDNYKKSLAVNPNNLNAKNNLVYAQKKLQQQQQQQKQQQQQQNNKPQKPDSSSQANSNSKPKQNNQQQPSKLTQQQAKQLLDGLKQDEQKILKTKIGDNNPQQNKLRKDW